MAQFCRQQADLLDRYWDEIARETMQSLGQGVPDQRKFTIPPRERSNFLDQLFAARDFLEPKYPSPPLIRCLFEREKRVMLDRDFAETESEFFRKLKVEESERLDIETSGWSGKKRDAIPFVERFCNALAFERRRERCWRKKTDHGLIFEVGIDLGGNPCCITVPLIFKIYHSDDRKLVFDIKGHAVFDHFVPGSILYRHGQTPSEWVHGIKAYIELFDIITHSFE